MKRKTPTFIIIVTLLLVSIGANGITLETTNDKLSLNENLKSFEENNANYVPGKVLVGISEKDSLTQESVSFLKTEYSGDSTEINEISNMVVVDVKPGLELDYIEAIGNDPRIEYAAPNYINFISRMPEDPMFSQQWGLDQSNDYDINAPEAWDNTTGSSDVIIAIIDTGIDYNHEDLAANCMLELGYDFVDDIDLNYYRDEYGLEKDPDEDYKKEDADPMDVNSHGTHCSGIASAVTDNGIGIAGVGWECKIMPIKAGFNMLYEYGGTIYDIGLLEDKEVIQSIDHAWQNGADVISMSFGKEVNNPAIEAACNRAWNNGVVLVASTGNSYKRTAGYPALYENVIGVGAIDSTGRRCDFSNYGNGLSLMAPGKDILSTVPGNGYEKYSGTSMACPHVAGVAALAKSRYGESNEDIRDRLERSADYIGSVMEYGNGLVDATFEEEAPPDEDDIVITVKVDYIKVLDYIDGVIGVSESKNGELYYNITVSDTDDYYEPKQMQTQFRYNKEGEPWNPFGWNRTDEWGEDGYHYFKPFEGQSWVYITFRVSEWDGFSLSDKLDISSALGNDDCTTCFQEWSSRELTVRYDLAATDKREYTGNGEDDGTEGDEPLGEKKQDDAEIRFVVEDNYTPPNNDGLTAVGFKDGYEAEVGSQNPGWVDPDDTVTFTASIEGGATPYTWEFHFADGNVSTVQTELGKRTCINSYQYSLNDDGTSRRLNQHPKVIITDYLGKSEDSYYPAPSPGIMVTNPPTKPVHRSDKKMGKTYYYVSSTDRESDGICFYFVWEDGTRTRNPSVNEFAESGEEVEQERESDATLIAVDQHGAYSETVELTHTKSKSKTNIIYQILDDIEFENKAFFQFLYSLFERIGCSFYKT